MTQSPRFRAAMAAALLAGAVACAPAAPPPPPFSVVEASISEMQQAMTEGRVTSRGLVEQYLQRIALYEERINATIAVNPNALADAERLDDERRQGKVRGPLHGIPIALKDNIHTTDMPTTGGAIAFEGLIPPYEATSTTLLREAGAVILAKTVMTELANWVASGMPGNYSALGGYGLNPYDPRRDPREATADGRPALGTGGSSSGIGTAANFWAANVGTETSGSILSPSNANMLAGIKPTVGRVSRYGVIPITADQDTAGPMAKYVADAAILLGAMEGAAPDPNDPATTACPPPPNRDYRPHLKADGLKGARIGIPRAFYYDPITPPGEQEPRGGLNDAQRAVMQEAIEVLKAQGAEVVDPADIPSIVATDAAASFLKWGTCAGPDNVRGKDADCSVALKYGMKRDFNAWLASLGPAAPVKTLADLRAFNLAHPRRSAIKYGQAQLDVSDEMDVERDRARWEADRAKDIALGGTTGITAAIEAHKLDALLFPGSSGAGIAAKPGYPTVIVPFGTVPNAPPNAPFPEGFDAKPAPYGVSFSGVPCSEPRLIELAYAFEQATKRRVPPPGLP
ncbi:MAG: amidase family protein [Acidobacteriota bacterium]